MQQSLFVIDISMMCAMVVLASMSRRLGEALKIRPYYRILYFTTACIFAAFSTDTFRETLRYPLLHLISMSVRAGAGTIAVAVCLPYWKWLLGEFFRPQR
jgi:hypothetical protein